MKLGLTLEGGASRTYFTSGILDVLMEENIKADYIIGASAGIAYGTSYASGQKGRNLEMGIKFMNDKRYMGFRHMLRPSNKAYYNLKFVFDEIPNELAPFDYEAFARFEGEVIAVLTNIETGKVEYVPVPRNDKTWQIIIASCSLPIMFNPVEINGTLYMDGGITDSIPVLKAIESGCDKNIVIITRERDYVKTKEVGIDLASWTFRKYPEFVKALYNRTDMYNRCHERLLKLEQEGKAFVFAPEDTKGWGRTDSEPDKLQLMYDAGYNMAKQRMEELKAYLNS